MEKIKIISSITGKKKRVNKDLLLSLPYYEMLFNFNKGANESVIDFTHDIFTDLLYFSNYGIIRDISEDFVLAINYFMILDIYDRDVDEIISEIKDISYDISFNNSRSKEDGDIILYKYQIEHIRNILNIFETTDTKAVMDYSIMGTGKTYTTCSIARYLN